MGRIQYSAARNKKSNSIKEVGSKEELRFPKYF